MHPDNLGFFRIFGAGTTFSDVPFPVGSSGCQPSAPEEWIRGAPIHLTFDRLEAVDLASTGFVLQGWVIAAPTA